MMYGEDIEDGDELELKLTTYPVDFQPRKLKVSWTRQRMSKCEMRRMQKTFLGTSAEEALIELASQEMKNEIDRSITGRRYCKHSRHNSKKSFSK